MPNSSQPRSDSRPSGQRSRHGGWYVGNVRYPFGACGCVSRNYVDRKWRIACDPRPFETQPTFLHKEAASAACPIKPTLITAKIV
ncbi:hypothetical protein CCR94_15570 [Rhodoblastus sphagnicola]|uniref:Uncharacterized protein n=1 Tax=Rhodoblastus sphagnicola TaxID=333368 RepID=A0A2S6N3V1_9HYPH|nr:hypothetical protein CCR94_15570 [Rhodoblastus sphagnicola]